MSHSVNSHVSISISPYKPALTVEAKTLREHAHATYSDFRGCKNDNFWLKRFDYFHIFAQNIDCGYTLDSNEYPQSMF